MQFLKQILNSENIFVELNEKSDADNSDGDEKASKKQKRKSNYKQGKIIF